MFFSLELFVNPNGICNCEGYLNASAKHSSHSAPNNDRVIQRSERVEEFDHFLALSGIGKTAAAGTYIIGEVGRIGGAGNNGGYCLMAEKKLQKELRPGRRVKIARPFRHALAANGCKYRASSKG
jgi:hypothetical protein